MAYRATSANLVSANCMNLVFQNLFSDMINVGFTQMTVNIANNNGNTAQAVSYSITVFKSPAANNLIANDWYVLIGTDVTTQTAALVTVAGGWNVAGTNLVSNFIPVVASAPVAANGFCSFGANTCNTSGNVFVYQSQVFPTTGNGINYFYSVTIDRIILCVANSATQTNNFIVYAGEYDSFMPLSEDPNPIILANTGTFSLQVNDVTVTRAGGAISEAGSNTATVGGNFSIQIGQWNQLNTQDPYMKGNYPITKTAISGRGGLLNQNGLRGFLKDVIACSRPTTKGDEITYTLNGVSNTYVYMGDGQSKSVSFGGGGSFNTFGGWVGKI